MVSGPGVGASNESKKKSSSWWVIIVLLILLAVVLLLFKMWKDKHDNTANVMAQMKTHKASVRGHPNAAYEPTAPSTRPAGGMDNAAYDTSRGGGGGAVNPKYAAATRPVTHRSNSGNTSSGLIVAI